MHGRIMLCLVVWRANGIVVLGLVLPTRVHAMFYVWVAAFACAKRNGWLFDSTTLFLFVPMITICFSLDGLGDFMPTGLASLWTASFVMFAGTVLSVLLLVFGLMGIVKTSTEEETLAEGYDANNEIQQEKMRLHHNDIRIWADATRGRSPFIAIART